MLGLTMTGHIESVKLTTPAASVADGAPVNLTDCGSPPAGSKTRPDKKRGAFRPDTFLSIINVL
jgi:hypothetical protein